MKSVKHTLIISYSDLKQFYLYCAYSQLMHMGHTVSCIFLHKLNWPESRIIHFYYSFILCGFVLSQARQLILQHGLTLSDLDRHPEVTSSAV